MGEDFKLWTYCWSIVVGLDGSEPIVTTMKTSSCAVGEARNNGNQRAVVTEDGSPTRVASTSDHELEASADCLQHPVGNPPPMPKSWKGPSECTSPKAETTLGA